MKSFLYSFFLPSGLCAAVPCQGVAAEPCRVAVTIDDLPIATSVDEDAATRRKITLWLLQSIVERDIPAIGFVNERKLPSTIWNGFSFALMAWRYKQAITCSQKGLAKNTLP